MAKFWSGLTPPIAALALPLFIQAYEVGRLPLDRLVQVIPDDAFFYLVLARNRALSGVWSFDHVAPATGFHLAYGYLLFALDKALPGLDVQTQINIILWSAAGLMLAGFACLLSAVRGSARTALAAGLLLLLAAPTGRIQAMLIMETPLVIAATALLCALVLRAGDGMRVQGWVVVVGAFGTFARTEFLLLPASFLAVALLLGRRDSQSRRVITTIGGALFGSLAGLAIVTLHTYLIGGALIQSSALVKRYWAQTYGYDPWPALLLFAQLSDPRAPNPWALCLSLGVLITSAVLVWRWRGMRDLRIVIAGATLFIPVAVLIYGFEPIGLQIWYFGIFFMPLALVFAAILGRLPNRILPLAALSAAVLALGSSMMAPMMLWTIQKSAMDAGLLLRADPSLDPVGNWGGGVISWFSGRDVINLDGLVNDDIYGYLAADRVDAYLDDRRLRYIVDLPSVLQSDGFERLYGMSCGRLTRRLLPLRAVEKAPEAPTDEAGLMLYQVLPAVPEYHLDEVIDFGQSGNAASFEGCGWLLPDASGTALGDGDAALLLTLRPIPSAPLEVQIDATAEAAATLILSTDEGEVGRWELTAGSNHVSTRIMAPSSGDHPLSLKFRTTGPAGSVAFRSVVLQAAPPPDGPAADRL